MTLSFFFYYLKTTYLIFKTNKKAKIFLFLKIKIDKMNSTNEHHSHGINFKISRVGALITMIILNLSFFLVELVIGNISNSNSLVADSFHMLSDLVSFIVALIAIRVSHMIDPDRNTYGWVRSEVLGSLVNAVFLLSLCLSIVIESIKRFFEPQNLEQIDLILIVGAIGLAINIFGLFIFGQLGGHHLHSHAKKLKKKKHFINENKQSGSLNIRGVFLHVLADALGSLAIIISTLLIKYVPNGHAFNWKLYVDPCLSLIIAILIVFSTIPLLKESSLILLQTVPLNVDLKSVKKELSEITGVLDIHHFHVWTLNSECFIGTLHVKVNDINDRSIFENVKNILHKHRIHSLTIQLEHECQTEEYDNFVQNECFKFQCCSQKHAITAVHPA